METGAETYDAWAGIVDGDERHALFAQVVAVDPGFDDYRARTTRPIPVVTLHRTGRDGMGGYLVEVHDWLRTELTELRRPSDRPTPTCCGSCASTAPRSAPR